MKFRTEIFPAEFAWKIDYGRVGFSVGSCFAASIAERLKRYKFALTSNPEGVLYNPASIARLLETNPAELQKADYVLITFGTAWVWLEGGKVVANCGKRPAALFTRKRLSVSEITEQFEALFEHGAPLYNKQVIFTVSPIRHLKDGAEENSLSKATLRLAIAQLVETQGDKAQYFPAYELLNDDLRDYRFYAEDLTHPTAVAVDYIWEKFAAVALTRRAQKLLPALEAIARATEHRPYEPDSEQHIAFRRQMLEQTRALAAENPELDFSAELEFFN